MSAAPAPDGQVPRANVSIGDQKASTQEDTPIVRTDDQLRHDLAEDQRRANLPGDEVASIDAVGRRRRQIAAVGMIVAVGMLFASCVAAGVIDFRTPGWIDARAAQYATIGFAICMVLYAFDKERYLRRFVHDREQLDALDAELARHLLTSGIVLDAAIAVHSTLSLAELLPTIAEQGRALAGADHAVLFIEEAGRPMEPVIDPESMATVAAPLAGLVAERRAVVAIVEDGTVDIGVPIIVANEVLAVLVLPGVVAETFGADNRHLLTRFGDIAGSALFNARRYEAAIFLFDTAV